MTKGKKMTKYIIVRMYADINKHNEVIRRNLTLTEAKNYCNREDTQEKGVWFDGYDEQV